MDSHTHSKGVTNRGFRRFGTALPGGSEAVAVEEPLEIRVGDQVVGITMRTPGADGLLALGFLYAEGIIEDRDDVGDVSVCGRPADEGYGNSIRVTLGPGATRSAERILSGRRWIVTTSACGVCGRRSIDDLLERCPVLPRGPSVSEAIVAAALDRLSKRQPNFERTGGVHAAGIFDAQGDNLVCWEDVGRHNAVDKSVGDLLEKHLAGRGPRNRENPGEPVLLAVSGRASFEIVQKAAVARIPVVASVSAASSLAIDLAEATGLTLASFVRNGSMNVYTHPERVRSA